MRFAQRNISYLRASPRVVLQTILYIDPTHLRWMNSRPYHEGIIGAEDDLDDGHDATGTGEDPADVESTGDEVWARTLNALRYKIMPKLLQESVEGSLLSSTNKKEKVDVHIDKDFQMAYFFQKITGRHAVLLKEKQMIFPQAEMGPPALPASAVQRQPPQDLPSSRLAARQQENSTSILAEGDAIADQRGGQARDDENAEGLATADYAGVEGSRVRKRRDSLPEEVVRPVRVKQEEDIDNNPLEPDMQAPMSPSPEPAGPAPETISIEETVEDKKPRLQVSYSGFQIFGKCLVIVIEPTKRVKRQRPGLFQMAAQKEKSQLSATPIPDEERSTPQPSRAGTQTRAGSSARARSATPRRALDDALDRADSRRLDMPASRNALFRGTPSDWEPTPPPASRQSSAVPGGRDSKGESAQFKNTDGGAADEEEDDAGTSVILATQMLEGGHMPSQGNDIDDD